MNKFLQSTIKCLSLIVIIAVFSSVFTGCIGNEDDTAAVTEPVDTISNEPVTLVISGAWEDCKAIEAVAREFNIKYPNCTVQYEYLQNYNESLVTRLTSDETVDIYFTLKIQADSVLYPYSLDLYSRDDFDISHGFDGLTKNYETKNSDVKQLYSVPLGAEMRGMYINKTLLDSLNIDVPTNQEQFLAACKKLKENGYIPVHGNPGMFGQTLLYPWICNIIANSDDPVTAYNKVNSRSAGLSEMFSEPFNFLYTLVKEGYYDYKTAQTNDGLYKDASDEGYARDFFNIVQRGDNYVKQDDVGLVAFMPAPLSLTGIIDRTKDDYHSGIEYVFVPAPVGQEGGFVYLSTAHAIAVNKNSPNLDWSVRFLNFLFTPTVNELFAKEFNVIPNTSEAFSYIKGLFVTPPDRISHIGQVTFDYEFYSIISNTLTEISKGNNPKYMKVNDDGTTSLYPLEYYTDAFDKTIQTVE